MHYWGALEETIVKFYNIGTWWNWGYDANSTIVVSGKFKEYLDSVYDLLHKCFYLRQGTSKELEKTFNLTQQTLIISPNSSGDLYGFVSCRFGSCHYSSGRMTPCWLGTFGKYEPNRANKSFVMCYEKSTSELTIRSF